MRGLRSIRALTALAGVALVSAGAPLANADGLGDQHEVPAIMDAIQSPVPVEAQQKAREFDDQLLQAGEMSGQDFVLVADARANRVKRITDRLLDALGESPRDWVLRVLETEPPRVNAFVAGGRYIYVFTGLIDAASSDDELAFVIGHELGHVLLKHHVRREADTTDTVADVATLIALLSDKYRQEVGTFAKVLRADYSRTDESEADALGVAIARKAGFDPARGVNFFSRQVRSQAQIQRENERRLEQARQAALQARAEYQEAVRIWKSDPGVRTEENKRLIDALYQEQERRRLEYNDLLAQMQAMDIRKQQQEILRGHPAPQNRTAAVAAAIDYLAGRRDLASLQSYEQTYRVFRALERLDSPLVDTATQ